MVAKCTKNYNIQRKQMNCFANASKFSTMPATHNKKSRKSELENFSLGQKTNYEFQYNPKLLDVFENKNPETMSWTTFICTEFTSLCPKTNQPDFAKIFINYIADKKMIESKSLKMYLFSFRNHGDFHEDCVQKITADLFRIMKPKYIEVIGEFTPRGGIAIFPFAQRANSEKKFQKISDERFLAYAPGKYSCDLNKVY
jgi:7-cyano-7-deazaguanine reductase